MTVTTGGWHELARWVVGFGGDAHVVFPGGSPGTSTLDGGGGREGDFGGHLHVPGGEKAVFSEIA